MTAKQSLYGQVSAERWRLEIHAGMGDHPQGLHLLTELDNVHIGQSSIAEEIVKCEKPSNPDSLVR